MQLAKSHICFQESNILNYLKVFIHDMCINYILACLLICTVGDCAGLRHYKPLVVWRHWTVDQRDWWRMTCDIILLVALLRHIWYSYCFITVFCVKIFVSFWWFFSRRCDCQLFSDIYTWRGQLIDCRWLQHAPGVPKILVGNRCHLAFKREVSELVAEEYAQRHDMAFLEVSPLCNFNVMESLVALSRVALQRNGMSRTWGINRGMTMIHAIVCIHYLFLFNM